MDRAGKSAGQLTGDELKVIFVRVREGVGREELHKELSTRNRTTIYRAFNVVSQFQMRGISNLDDKTATEIAENSGYNTTVRYVQNAFAKWDAWTKFDNDHSEDDQQDRSPFYGSWYDLLSLFVDKMWVPEAESFPSFMLRGGPGLRSVEVRGREFSWTQGSIERLRWDSRAKKRIPKIGLEIVSVWFTDTEEVALVQHLVSLDRANGGHLAKVYRELQTETLSYLKRIRIYKRGVQEDGWETISRIEDAELGGSVNPENPYIAPGYNLMEEYPRLSGLVERFKSDVRIAILRNQAPESA